MFKVIISAGGSIGNIKAWLPEEVELTIEQKYEEPFQQLRNPLVEFVAEKFGVTTQWDVGAKFVWMGSTPIQFTLSLIFIAETSVYTDIVEPIRKLMQLSAPRPPSGNLMPMRPPVDPDHSVSMRIGKILYTEGILITSVNPMFSRPFVVDESVGAQGIPSRVPVAVTIQSKEIMRSDEVSSMFFPEVIV